MSKPRFYQAILQPLNEVQLKQITKGQTIAERMGTEEASCPKCGNNEWWLLPRAGAAVKQGGKPYCECLNCGYSTHL
jgi:DNA-directed RNA polymerase subunit M/transcription elongation factor TFIIS